MPPNLHSYYKGDATITPILCVIKLRLEKINSLSRPQSWCKLWSQESHPPILTLAFHSQAGYLLFGHTAFGIKQMGYSPLLQYIYYVS